MRFFLRLYRFAYIEKKNSICINTDHHLKNAVPIYVGNLPKNIKRLKLVKMFKKFGKILSIRFRTNSGKSFFKKAQVAKAPFLIAFIFFETREAAEASLVCNGTQIGDNVITVDLDADKRVEVKHPPKNTVVVGNLKYGKLYSSSILSLCILNKYLYIKFKRTRLPLKSIRSCHRPNSTRCVQMLRSNRTYSHSSIITRL